VLRRLGIDAEYRCHREHIDGGSPGETATSTTTVGGIRFNDPQEFPCGEATIRLSPTPAAGAGLPAGEIDRRDRRLTQAGAIGIVLATYLLITASPILGSFRTGIDGLVMQQVDYGSFVAWRDLATRLGQIGGTVLILVLICRWLGIRRDLAGFPRQRTVSPIPAVLTVAICAAGHFIATIVIDAITPAGANTNANGGGSVDNGWGWLQIIDAVHTSIVEEIIVVAVPVLVGRRAGWHPALVIALCAFLRWPYHTYHGVLITLPWALIWGGAFAAAYLYLRRLTPIIVVHVLIDLPIMLGDVTPWADTITYSIAAALVLWLIALGLADRRRRALATNQPTLVGNGQAQPFLLRHNKSGLIMGSIMVALAVLLAVLLIVAGLFVEPTELGSDVLMAAAILAAAGIGCFVVWRVFTDSNVYVSPGSGAPITGAVRWHPTYVGTTVVDEIRGSVDTATAITDIAASNPYTALSFLPPKDQERHWRDLGFRTRGGLFNTSRIRVRVRYDPGNGAVIPAQGPRTTANALGAELPRQRQPVDPAPVSRAGTDRAGNGASPLPSAPGAGNLQSVGQGSGEHSNSDSIPDQHLRDD